MIEFKWNKDSKLYLEDVDFLVGFQQAAVEVVPLLFQSFGAGDRLLNGEIHLVLPLLKDRMLRIRLLQPLTVLLFQL